MGERNCGASEGWSCINLALSFKGVFWRLLSLCLHFEGKMRQSIKEQGKTENYFGTWARVFGLEKDSTKPRNAGWSCDTRQDDMLYSEEGQVWWRWNKYYSFMVPRVMLLVMKTACVSVILRIHFEWHIITQLSKRSVLNNINKYTLNYRNLH